MKFTKVKTTDNSQLDLDMLGQALVLTLRKKGYITEFSTISASGFKLDLHMQSFKIDTEKLGYNYRTGCYVNTKTGFKRTNVPTWSQRVDYNNIVNKVLNKYKISAKVVSGDFNIRDGVTSKTEYDWSYDTDHYEGKVYNALGQLLSRVETKKEYLARMKGNQNEKNYK